MTALAVHAENCLTAHDLSVGYGHEAVIDHLDVGIPKGSLTAILGPNASGKSTLLKALTGIVPARSGRVTLEGKDLHSLRPKQIARRMALLPQSAVAPDGLRVADLVARGRYPHRGLLRQWTSDDERAVHDAMEATHIGDISARFVGELSGGQRQRVWIAMTLAQQTPIILLDEPTTFLDIEHQLEILELCSQLNAAGRTLVIVLHDLAHAARHATNLIVMKDGRLAAEGAPKQVINARLIADVFNVAAVVDADPVTKTPAVFPYRRDQGKAPTR